jgi:protease-4
MVVALIALVLLGFSLLINLSQFAGGLVSMKGVSSPQRMAGPRLDEVLLEDNGSANKIAVLDVEGIITSRPIDSSGFTMVDLLKLQLERAKNDRRVKAVVLRVDSPGGEVLASDEIYRAIHDFQENSDKPVIASMGNLAASGGYYVSAPCRWIVANEMTITGSIGVIMHTWNYRSLMDKVGLRPEIYKSGEFKDMLSGARKPEEITQEERDMVQALINETYERFQSVIAEGRSRSHELNQDSGRELVEGWQNYADGRVMSGSQAQELGFVDSLGNFRDAVKQALVIAEADDANLIKYQQRYDLSDFLRIFGQAESKVIKVDLGVEAPKLEAGKLYFLSPTFVR